MTRMEQQIKSLVLGFFSKINANVIEKDDLLNVSISNNYFDLFKTNLLKITFDPEISKNTEYELISPGSNILLKILNKCLDFGPIISARLMSNHSKSKIIRFYFYVIFESIKTKTKLLHIDVDIDSKSIVKINDSEINFNENSITTKLNSESFDECYIKSITYLEQNLMKSEITDFKKQILELKEDELKNILFEYRKRNKEIQEKYIKFRSKGISGTSFDNLMDENKDIHDEEIKIKENLDKKYSIMIDFALISVLILT